MQQFLPARAVVRDQMRDNMMKDRLDAGSMFMMVSLASIMLWLVMFAVLAWFLET